MNAIAAGESALTQQKLALCSAALRSGETIRIRAFGASMLPTIWPGDVLVIAGASSEEFVCGDIVLAKRESLVIHRLMKRTVEHCVLRGDAMAQNDAPFSPADVLGKVVEIRRGGCVVVPQQGIQPLWRALAFLLCHSWVCRTIALRVHAKFAERNPENSLATGMIH